MYLKSIEIQGFKSFANKMVFEFHNGITAIVGPNGSGKSNVADAVRWVLGEQSAKQLRSGKMEDVIFAGTETRKPLGFAYVAITLNNQDYKLPIEYQEVTIARRVYRSGESEYLLNGKNCLLRDIQQLFLDTGIGQEGYSIIGQGQIDKILSGRPEDRRELFDEAVGIVKFKKRKWITEKNLESERLNLSRIYDIVLEMQRQLEPLEEQSVKAKQYLKLKEQLKEKEIQLFLKEYIQVESKQKEWQEQFIILTEQLDEKKENYKEVKEKYKQLEEQLEEYNKLLDCIRTRQSECNIKKEQLEGNGKVYLEQISGIKQTSSHIEERIFSIKNYLAQKEKEKNEYCVQKQELERKIAILVKRKIEIWEQLEKTEQLVKQYSTKIEQYQLIIYETLNENAAMKSKLQRYEIMVEQSQQKQIELLEKETNLQLLIEENKKQKEDREIELRKLESTLEQIKENSNIIEEKIEQKSQIIALDEKQLLIYQQNYHQESSKLDSLKNITERYEGYGNSIRKIMEQKGTISGILGVVADIISVKQEYEIAIETALGGNIQNIIIDKEQTAKQLIEFLKKYKYGRATFLPLTSIPYKKGGILEKVLEEKGVIGVAASLVKVKSAFINVIQFLLGRVVVVNTIEDAILLARKYNYTLRIVTLEGELLSPGGSISGGSYRNASNLLSRKRELEQLERKIEVISNDIKEREQCMVRHKMEQAKQTKHAFLQKEKMQQLNLQQNTMHMNQKQIVTQQETNTAQLNALKKELELINVQQLELQDEIKQIKEKIGEKEEKNKEIEQHMERVNQFLQETREKEKDTKEQYTDLKLQVSSYEQQNLYLIENIKRVNQEIEDLEKQLKEIKESSIDAEKQIIQKEHLIQDVREEIEQLEETKRKIEEQWNDKIEKKEQLSKHHKSFFTLREQIMEDVSNLEKEVLHITNLREKGDEQLNQMKQYMWEEYELTYYTIIEDNFVRVQEQKNVKQMISQLKQMLKELGNINVNALEDYKNLMERYQLLKTQHDDLVKAEKVLVDIIKELDIEMRKQFEEKFKLIQTEFQQVFQQLFGGGNATLELIEKIDILEAGIRVIAQPPGKKLQNMMQLSGGEKALTAIALLFAIQNLKPSPFCLLDEIEAALDDSNVERFANYLHKLTNHTQFIMITHRRGTMKVADTLYGITMQEKGVSTLVSVRLIEDKLEA